ncbi:MAG: 8-oxo-dGTP diphosphatase [Lachnospiraceae bacterium]|nr:8-oxo-dGTP diphosphatase [Lachnospiraceae bacterium]
MARTEQVELTCLCMITKGDMVLLQNRVKKDWKGYTLPGGHIEPGESFVDAVIREMKEETGLEIKNPKLCGIKQFPIEGGRYLVVLFKTDEFEGELVSSEEGQMEWISRSELEQVNIVEDLPELFQVMEDDSLMEFQYVMEDGEWKVVLK